VNDHDGDVALAEGRIIGANSLHEVVEGAGEFGACEATARDDERQETLPLVRGREAVGALEHFNDAVAHGHRVVQRLEVQCVSLDVG